MEFSRDTNSCIQPQEYERYEKVVMDAKGNLKVVPLRRGKGDSAFIDTISFTFHESSVAKFFFNNKGIFSD